MYTSGTRKGESEQGQQSQRLHLAVVVGDKSEKTCLASHGPVIAGVLTIYNFRKGVEPYRPNDVISRLFCLATSSGDHSEAGIEEKPRGRENVPQM